MDWLTIALRPGPFADSLAMQPPASMDDLRRRATQYMQVEELRELAKVEQNQVRRNDRERDQNPPRYREPPRGQRFARYTPLTAGRARILEEALNTELIPELRKCLSPPNADQSKYCQYHRNHDHKIGELQPSEIKLKH